MKKKPFVAQTSMVPVLACIAALLFSANFYQFMQKNFKKWWGWDFRCPAEQVDCQKTHRHRIFKTERHNHRHHRQHRRHLRDRLRDHEHRHQVRDRHTIILDLEGERNVDRNLQEAQRNLEQNLERALRDLERLHERMEWDADVDINVERLETEIRIKLENLEDLNRIQRKLQLHFPEQDAPDEIVREYRVGDDNVKVRIQRH